MKKKLSTVFLTFIVCTIFAANPVKSFTDNDLLRKANISITVKDLNTGKIVESYRPECATVPASTLKLVTTATALELLGPEFRFSTTLETDGLITADSTLNGNLYIHGSGDPTLGSAMQGDTAFLTNWKSGILKAGIKRINGSIVADATRFDTQGINPKWLWEDMGNYYGAGAYGISYKDNLFTLELRSGKAGSTPEIVKMIPEIPDFKFENNLKSSAIGFDSAYFYGAPFSNFRMIYGEIPANRPSFKVKGDIPRPGLLLARDFTAKLQSAGIQVSGIPTDVLTGNNSRSIIYTHFSPPLREIIREINVQSNNHYAEHVFRYLSLVNDTVATSRGSVSVIRKLWASKSLPVDELFMYDGSGLSPVNAVSSGFMAGLLEYMDKSPNKEVFKASLPVAGTTGTLKSFLKNTPLQGKVRAKSGSIHRVKCYAGYINTKGKNYAFSIMVNNPNGTLSETTKKMEEFLLYITK